MLRSCHILVLTLSCAGCVSRPRFEALQAEAERLRSEHVFQDAQHKKEVERLTKEAGAAETRAEVADKHAESVREILQSQIDTLKDQLTSAREQLAYLKGRGEQPPPKPPARVTGPIVVVDNQKEAKINVTVEPK